MVKSLMQLGVIFVICYVLFSLQPAWADEGNIDGTYKYAWSENSGWENFRPTHGGVAVNDTYLSGYAWAENIGWVSLGSGTGPYDNSSNSNWGVNHDSATGALSGYAWSENVGWINFNATANNPTGVSINTNTLKFSGYAWAENVGYVNFQNTSPEYYVMQEATAPTVTTQAVSNIAVTTATGNGNITGLGLPNPTQHGVCWSTSQSPTTDDSKTEEGAVSTTGAFTSSITGLTAGTEYYARAYATSIAGTSYGGEVSFTTLPNAPSAPVATAATSITETGFNANWNAAAGAEGYRLDVATDSGFTSFVSGYEDKGISNVTTSPVTGLSAGTTYYYRVRASNASGTGGNSNTITVAILAVPTKVDLTGPGSVTAGSVSSVFTLRSQDAGDNPADVNEDTVFNLTSDSTGTETFYSDASGTTSITQATIANGTSSTTFYYKDTTAGTPTITATQTSGMALGADTHPVIVTANNALGFDGIDDYVDVGTGPSGVKCVEFRVNPGSTTEYFVDLDGGTHLIWADAGVVTAAGFSNPTIYVNGVQTTAIVSGQWQHVAVTTDTGIDADALAMGKSGSNYFQGKMDEIRLWGVAPSLTTLRGWMYRDVNSLHPDWNDMRAYYKFNAGSGTTAYDLRNGHDGVLTNGPPWMTSGAFEGPRNGLDFDGTDDYVDIGTGPCTVKTVSFWVYPSSAGCYFMDLDGGTHLIWANAGVVTATGFSSPTIYVNGVETTAIAANQWQHVTVTTDTGINANALDIGASGSNYLHGKMDEVRVWKDVRTATEIRDNMCRSLTGNEDGLAAYYRFDQYNTAGQTTLYDITGGYNGTLTNMDPATDWVPSTAYNAWVGSDGTDWASGGNWSLYAQPGSSDNAGLIHYASPGNAPTIGAAAVSRHLVVATDATLKLGANTLTLNGNWIKNGTAFLASGSVVFSGAEGAGIIGATSFNNLTVDKSGNSVTLGDNVGVTGTLTLTDGELNNGSATLRLGNGATLERSGGSLTNAPVFTTSVDVVYSGTTNITTGHELPTSTTILNDLTVNKAGGVVVNADVTVNHTLNLTNGLVTLGDNDLSLSLNATLGDTPSSSNMVVTNGTGVFKKVFGGTGSFIFPVGDNTATAEYSPVTLNFTSGTFNSAYTSVGVINAKQPQNPSTTDYLNRYWSVTQSGITGFSCTATFSYVPADIQGTEADIYGGQYKDDSWTVFNAVNTGSHTFEATVSDFSDFTGIEAASPGTQANNISFGNVAQTEMQVSWTRGNGENVLIVAHQGSAVDSNPVDGASYNADAAFGSGSEIGTGNFVVYKGAGTSVTVTGLTADTTYYFRAYEYNDTVDERYNTSTAAGNPENRTTRPDAPSAPVATGATSITETGFSTNWNAATGATGYRLDVATDSGFSSFVSGYNNKDVGDVTSSSVSGLSGGTAYYYRVRAENAGGTSSSSNTIETTTLCSAPVATDATSVTQTGFSANWNAATGAEGYRLDVATDSGFTSFVFGYEDKDVGNITTSSVSGLSAVTDYYYRVRAENIGGARGNSNTITVATTDGTGVPAKIQDAAPNNGDGNGDNIKDSKQTNVASLPSAPDGSYLTVELFGCDQIRNVAAYTYESVGKPDPGYTYPFDLVGFNIPCKTSTVIIYYHGADNFEGYTYRKYGPTPVDWNVAIWYAMKGVTFGTEEIGGITVPYVEFILTEAQLGDDTHTSPIVDQGGIARAAAIPTMNEWGMIILAVLMVFMALGAIRRQRVED